MTNVALPVSEGVFLKADPIVANSFRTNPRVELMKRVQQLVGRRFTSTESNVNLLWPPLFYLLDITHTHTASSVTMAPTRVLQLMVSTIFTALFASVLSPRSAVTASIYQTSDAIVIEGEVRLCFCFVFFHFLVVIFRHVNRKETQVQWTAARTERKHWYFSNGRKMAGIEGILTRLCTSPNWWSPKTLIQQLVFRLRSKMEERTVDFNV